MPFRAPLRHHGINRNEAPVVSARLDTAPVETQPPGGSEGSMLGRSIVTLAERTRLLRLLDEGIAEEAIHGRAVVESPLSDFTSRDLLAQENQVFFRQSPLLMGLSDDLPGSGSYWAHSHSGLPILMVRDDAGTFRAFANTCRHRGAEIVPSGRGSQLHFTCPFHGWTYSCQGDLIAVRNNDAFGSLDPSGRGLIEFPATETQGMLWVSPIPSTEEQAPAAHNMLEELKDDMAHWRLGMHRYGASQLLTARINWKLAIDTFGENYHFDVLHRDTVAKELHGNVHTHDVFGPHCRMVFASKPGFAQAKALSLDIGRWPFRLVTLTLYFIFPNTIMLIDGGGVDVFHVFPDGDDPGRSTTLHSFYISPQARFQYKDDRQRQEHCDKRLRSVFNAIVNEDFAVARSIQRCAEAGIQRHVLFGRNEPALVHWHDAHRSALCRPLLRSVEDARQ